MKNILAVCCMFFVCISAANSQSLVNWKHYYAKGYYPSLALGNAIVGSNAAELILIDKSSFAISRIPFPAGIRKDAYINECYSHAWQGPGQTIIANNNCADTANYLWDGLGWVPFPTYQGFNTSDIRFLKYTGGSIFFISDSAAAIYKWDGTSLTSYDTLNSPYKPAVDEVVLASANDDIFLSNDHRVAVYHSGVWHNYGAPFFNFPSYVDAYYSAVSPAGDYSFYSGNIDSSIHTYHHSTNTWSSIQLPLSMSHKYYPANYVYMLRYDDAENLWLIGDSVFCRFDGTVFHDHFNGLSGNSLSLQFPWISNVVNDKIFLLIEGDQYAYNITSDSLRLIQDTMAILPSNQIRPSIKDVNGNLWFGTLDGSPNSTLIKYNGSTWKMVPFDYGTYGGNIYTLEQDTGQALLIGYGGLRSAGPIRFTDDSVFTPIDPSGSWMSYMVTTAVAIDAAHHYWFGGPGSGVPMGVCEYGSNGLVQHYAPGSMDNVYALDIDSIGNKWIGFYDSTSGIYRFNGGFLHFNSGNSPVPANKQIVQIQRERNTNRMWFSTFGGGALSYYNGIWTVYDTANSPLVSNFVRYIYFDEDSTTWFCTAGGVSSLRNGIWHTYSNYNSPLHNGFIRSIVRDNNCSVWMTMWGGLSTAELAGCDASAMLVTGTVYQVNNTPAPNASILVFKLNNAGTGADYIDNIFADYAGNYNYTAADTGRYFFRAGVSTTLFPGQITAYPDSALIIQQSSSVHVTSQGTYSADIKLRQTVPSPGTCRVKGQLISTTQQPITSIRMLLMLNNQPVASTITDGDGRFQFGDIDSTVYTLWVDKYGFDNSAAPMAIPHCGNTQQTDTFFMFLNQITGIGEHEPVAANDIKIYPNPARGFIYVDMRVADRKTIAEVFNPDGKVVASINIFQNHNTLDLSLLPAGMYFLHIRNSSNSITRKIVFFN